MIARYRSVCPCGRRINPGDTIESRPPFAYCAKCAQRNTADRLARLVKQGS